MKTRTPTTRSTRGHAVRDGGDDVPEVDLARRRMSNGRRPARGAFVRRVEAQSSRGLGVPKSARAKRASGSKTLGKQSTHPLLREPCQGPLRIARKGSWRSREGLLEAKSTATSLHRGRN